MKETFTISRASFSRINGQATGSWSRPLTLFALCDRHNAEGRITVSMRNYVCLFFLCFFLTVKHRKVFQHHCFDL